MRIYRTACILKHDGMQWAKGETVEGDRLQGVLHGLLASGAIVAEDVSDVVPAEVAGEFPSPPASRTEIEAAARAVADADDTRADAEPPARGGRFGRRR